VISRFFIDRPIFATVISVVITLAGGVAVFTLPVAQYPDVTPPTVQVTASYPGANANTLRDTVAAPIEEQVSGVEGMLYMSSLCTNNGAYTLTVTFQLGTDSDMAQVLVQNRVALALPVVPGLVQTEGVTVKKQSPNTLLIVNLLGAGDKNDPVYLSNYATIYLKDELARVDGVAGISYLGQRDYSMRAWLDPDRLAALHLNAFDVVSAIAQQNVQVAAGQVGQPPVPRGQQFQLTINTQGRLSDAEQFGDIVVKVGSGSQGTTANATVTDLESLSTGIVRLRDVVTRNSEGTAKVELMAQQYDTACTLNGRQSVALSVYQLPGSNALAVSQNVRATMKQLAKSFPDGVSYQIVYDTTPFIRESVNEVFKTLRDAVILVAIVVLLFLQDWRAMILPIIDVPVSLIGTFAVMAVLGFTLNNLTLFGLVLAIGIVVDDAIVVLENIERLIGDGLDPRSATIRAMEEITGPILAITLVLSAVFVPVCFLGGITGQFFRQFALTIAVSTIISAINALTMTPSRAVVIFRSEHGKSENGGGGHHREALPWWIFGILGGVLTVWLWPQIPFVGSLDLPDIPLGEDTSSLPDWLYRILPLDSSSLPAELTADEMPSWLYWSIIGVHFMPGLLIGLAIGWYLIKPVNATLGYVFRGFNRLFDRLTQIYGWVVGGVLHLAVVMMLAYVGLLVLTGWQFATAPVGFVPEQDKGYLVLTVQLQDAASLERTNQVMARIDQLVRGQRDGGILARGVWKTLGVAGQSLITNASAPNLGSMYILLREFAERPGLSADQVREELLKRCQHEVPDALLAVFGGPPIDGLGTTAGFKLIIENRGNFAAEELDKVTSNIVDDGNSSGVLRGLFSTSRADTPWLNLELDRSKCLALGVQVTDVFTTLQVYLGSYYVNNFNQFGRTWQVNVQADADFRAQAHDIKKLQVRNQQGQMIPLGSLVTIHGQSGPVAVMRYNMYSSAAILGNTVPGVSSGEAIRRMEAIADRQLPRGTMARDWTELTYLQKNAGNTAAFVFGLAVLFVFLVLAAQYESWSLPLAVILVVPMCLLCSITVVTLAGLEVNIFTQIGFVVLVGLASKNAILIVEVAKQRQEAGVPRRDAALEGARLRLRPILMTSFAFIFGVVPLVLATGAGAEMRRALGLAVFSGMLGVTFFGVFLTPVFFYLLRRHADRRADKPA
jgi:multidrug efflux pump subunit AcrB